MTEKREKGVVINANDSLALQHKKLEALVGELVKTDPQLVAQVAGLCESQQSATLRNGKLEGGELHAMINRFPTAKENPLQELERYGALRHDGMASVSELKKSMEQFVYEHSDHVTAKTASWTPGKIAQVILSGFGHGM